MTPIELCAKIAAFESFNRGWYPGIYEGKSPSQVESEVGTNVMDSTKNVRFADYEKQPHGKSPLSTDSGKQLSA